MSHPCVVTLDQHSRPRVLPCAHQFVELGLPQGTVCLYPKPPEARSPDFAELIHNALQNPLHTAPLHRQLRAGMRVTLALADGDSPRLAVTRCDVRQQVLHVLLPLLAEHGIDDIEIVLATGLRRRRTPREIRRLVGPQVFGAYWPERLHNHCPEDRERMAALGAASAEPPLQLCRRALDSDLLIWVGVRTTPQQNTLESILLHLGGYANHHLLRDPLDLTQQGQRQEGAFAALEQRLKVFAIEATVDRPEYTRGLVALGRNEDDLSLREHSRLTTLLKVSTRVPNPIGAALHTELRAAPRVTAVLAGDVPAVQRLGSERCMEQRAVLAPRQADALLVGLAPDAFDDGTAVNPLLLAQAVLAVGVGSVGAGPLVRKGGSLILHHPCTDQFNLTHHTAHQEFMHRVLPETREVAVLRQRYEPRFAHDPALLAMFRQGYADHPAVPFFMWYTCEALRQHLGRVIVVGADNEYIPQLLGWETASNLEQALYRARGEAVQPLAITCLPWPSWVTAGTQGAL